MKKNINNMSKFLSGFLVLSFLVLPISNVFASSHREAPLISGDPKADATDLYVFRSPDKPDTVTILADYIPFQEPAGGPNFYPFDDNVLYEIKIDNNADAVPDIVYQFRFKTMYQNKNTFLYNTGPITSLDSANWNARQTYTLTKVDKTGSHILATDVPTTPSNIGPKSTPEFSKLAAQAIKDLGNNTKVMAGQIDDPFFAELGGLFDLVTIRKLPGNMGGGVDGLAGYNVNTLALQIPITDLTSNNLKPEDVKDTHAVIGVWTTASRQATTVLSSDGKNEHTGEWIQVSRLGAPLVNEVVIPIEKKDMWNGSKPENDGQFANYVANPELAGLLKTLYNVQVPPQGMFGSSTQRDDLEAIFLTGIPGLTNTTTTKPSEELRLNVAVMPSTNPNRMGVLGGDTAGFPNGRRLGDDVVDIEIQAVAGAAYPLFHPTFTPDPLATKLGDGVDSNDVPFRTMFPYAALPHSGFASVPHANAGYIKTLLAKISELTAQLMKFMGVGGTTGGNEGGNSNGMSGNSSGNTQGNTYGGTNNGNMQASTTENSTTPTSSTLTPSSQTVPGGHHVDFNGRNFGHEETVRIMLNGTEIGTAHADGGGNFSTGSLSIPQNAGTYTYIFTGANSGISQTSTFTVK